MFEGIESSIGHIYAHGTSPEEVIVGSAEIQHPKTKARNWCDLDSELVLYGTMSFSLVGNVAGGIWWGRGTRRIKRLKHATPSHRLDENTGLTRSTDIKNYH